MHRRHSIEFTVSYAAKKSVPFARGKVQNRTSGIPAVANPDSPIGHARYLNAVTIGQTQGTLHPVGT
jgi:hypothetical protein